MTRKQIEEKPVGSVFWTWQVIGNTPEIVAVVQSFKNLDNPAAVDAVGRISFKRLNNCLFAFLEPWQLFESEASAKIDLVNHYQSKLKLAKAEAEKFAWIIKNAGKI